MKKLYYLIKPHKNIQIFTATYFILKVCILRSKAVRCLESGKFRCPVPGCSIAGCSRVGVAKHFRKHHRNYRSWRDVFLNKDAPHFVLKTESDHGPNGKDDRKMSKDPPNEEVEGMTILSNEIQPQEQRKTNLTTRPAFGQSLIDPNSLKEKHVSIDTSQIFANEKHHIVSSPTTIPNCNQISLVKPTTDLRNHNMYPSLLLQPVSHSRSQEGCKIKSTNSLNTIPVSSPKLDTIFQCNQPEPSIVIPQTNVSSISSPNLSLHPNHVVLSNGKPNSQIILINPVNTNAQLPTQPSSNIINPLATPHIYAVSERSNALQSLSNWTTKPNSSAYVSHQPQQMVNMLDQAPIAVPLSHVSTHLYNSPTPVLIAVPVIGASFNTSHSTLPSMTSHSDAGNITILPGNIVPNTAVAHPSSQYIQSTPQPNAMQGSAGDFQLDSTHNPHTRSYLPCFNILPTQPTSVYSFTS